MAEAALPPSAVKGMGFDATCSLVVLDAAGHPLTVSTSGDERRNVIVWMDHRATTEARLVNDTQDDVLRYVGGSISPEMEIPKLLWLKRHLPSTYNSAGHFLDLADYLSFRATGSTARSTCTVTCKWNFLAHEQRWSGSYFERIGLGDLVGDGYAKIGKDIVAPGTALGAGLTESAALDFGLLEGTPVGASLIDAHAGGVGMIGGRITQVNRSMSAAGLPTSWGPRPASWRRRPSLASCRACGVPIIRAWFPASGSTKAVNRRPVRPSIISSSPILPITRSSRRRMPPAWRFWNFSSGASSRVRQTPDAAALFARDVHVLPEFLGNRSPFADPDSRAIVAGLDLDADIGSMERLFVAGLCGLAYGLADVVDAFRSHGVDSDLMVIGGGAGRSSLVRQIMADTTGLTVALPETQEPVLLGAAMLGAVAAAATDRSARPWPRCRRSAG